MIRRAAFGLLALALTLPPVAGADTHSNTDRGFAPERSFPGGTETERTARRPEVSG